MPNFDAWLKTLKNHEKLSPMEVALMRAAWEASAVAALAYQYEQRRSLAAA